MNIRMRHSVRGGGKSGFYCLYIQFHNLKVQFEDKQSESMRNGDLSQWYMWRPSDRKVAGSTSSSGDFFTLRQGDSLTLLLGWIAEGYCM